MGVLIVLGIAYVICLSCYVILCVDAETDEDATPLSPYKLTHEEQLILENKTKYSKPNY